MKITRANVEQYAKEKGLKLIQINEIPDGFAWKEPNITISSKTYKGKTLIFKALSDWADKDAIIYE